MALEDYKEIVGTAASITTIGQFFAGVFVCRDIVKQGNTRDVSVVPFLGGTVIGVLMMQYANLLNDPVMQRVNYFGVGLNVLYLICYYIYCEDKGALHTKMLQSTLFGAVLLGYTQWEDPEVLEFRYGLILTILLFYLIASPLFSLGEVIRTQSTASLPFPIIASSLVVTFLWLLYGIILDNVFIQFQNVVGFGLCAIQMSLFAIYPSKPKVEAKEH